MATTIHFAWNASADPTVAGYIMHGGPQRRQYTLENDVGNQLDGTLTFPTFGKWHVAIGAYNAARAEALGDELQIFIASADYVINPYIPTRWIARR